MEVLIFLTFTQASQKSCSSWPFRFFSRLIKKTIFPRKKKQNLSLNKNLNHASFIASLS